MVDTTIMQRQIHSSFVQQGRVTSQAFTPTPKDNKKLSVYDGDQIDPEDAWIHYTNDLGHASVGIMGLTVLECSEVGLPAVPDPDPEGCPVPFPEHAYIDFTAIETANAIKKHGKQLCKRAASRDWLYQDSE